MGCTDSQSIQDTSGAEELSHRSWRAQHPHVTWMLDNRTHAGDLWRSDVSQTLYRWRAGSGWEMFFDGQWTRCHSEHGNCYYELVAEDGECFINAGEDVTD